MKISKIVVVSGGFDPCHSGHIAMCNAAKKLGETLIVGINSDAWLTRKKGQAFMPWEERANIVGNLKSVDTVIAFDDTDNTAIDLLNQVKKLYPTSEIIFANGGDRTDKNIPEMSLPNITFKFGVGGEDKKNSSSWILAEWKAPKTERQWGYYRVLHEAPGMKVKELTVNPGKSLSMQRHFKRSEYWVVEEGACDVAGEDKLISLRTHETIDSPVNSWHQLINPFDKPCKIVEIQYGKDCQEEDIERK
jgi:cytidyltransferase-like protein